MSCPLQSWKWNDKIQTGIDRTIVLAQLNNHSFLFRTYGSDASEKGYEQQKP